MARLPTHFLAQTQVSLCKTLPVVSNNAMLHSTMLPKLICCCFSLLIHISPGFYLIALAIVIGNVCGQGRP